MKQLIGWFAENSVTANLLMFAIVASGILSIGQITQEVFPEFSLDMISVSVIYPGASPEEVEEAICVRIEEEVQGVDGIKRITSTSAEGVGAVMIELLREADPRKVLDDVKARVDAIDTFPEDAEEPVITEMTNRRQVIDVAIWGDATESTLKELGERVRDEIAALPGITQVELVSVRPYEISVEVSESALRRYGITFDDVVRAVRRSSLDLPGGSLKTSAGEILVRTKGQAYRGREFEDIVLLTRTDGTRLMLGDVATVVDGFAETDQFARFDGKPTAVVQVYRVGDQSALDVTDKVKAYVAEAQAHIPEGITLTTWRDYSRILRGRLELMLRNGRNGFILVFLVLALFLRFRLAFWVSLGIPISFLGALWLMPPLDVSINLISAFAFIIVLGIVVDDAIVVGENVYSNMQRGKKPLRAAIDGAIEVAVPVTFAVLTTIAAFSPLLAVPGTMGKIMRVIPIIVILTLAFSLVESLLILPAHLGHTRYVPDSRNGGGRDAQRRSLGSMLTAPLRRIARGWKVVQQGFNRRLEWLIHDVYRPSLRFGLEWRYLTAAWAIVTLLVTIGLVGGGWIRFTFMPRVEADFVAATLTMPQGTPAEVTAAAVERLEASAEVVRQETDGGNGEVVLHMVTSIGEQPSRAARGPMGGASAVGSHLGEVAIELSPAEERDITSTEVMNRWRQATGPIPDATELTFSSALFSPGSPIDIQLAGVELEQLTGAAEAVKKRLADYPGVFDIADSFREGKREIKLKIKPAAETLGLTLADLARQVRQGFYGEEAQRVQRGRDDIKVMVRYPADERRSLGDLENMRIRTPSGGEVPFHTVAEAEYGRGYDVIRRTDRQRAVDVTADVDETKANAGEILADLKARVLPEVLADFRGVSFSFEGEQREQREMMANLLRGFMLALILIYALMAIPFKSYAQPLIVMLAIPFGLVGAIWGHAIMRLDLAMISMFGIVALTGVVVNDSIVLVDFINRRVKEGIPLVEAVRQGGEARFRPILLTSLTTFAGLTPLLLERSMQAKFLIPMAVSLAFGVVFATFITLVLVPAGYLILEDVKRLVARLFRRQHTPAAAEAHAARR